MLSFLNIIYINFGNNLFANTKFFMRRKKDYVPWDSPYYRQMNRSVDKLFGKKPDDPDQSHWIIVFIIFIVVGFLVAATKY